MSLSSRAVACLDICNCEAYKKDPSEKWMPATCFMRGGLEVWYLQKIWMIAFPWRRPTCALQPTARLTLTILLSRCSPKAGQSKIQAFYFRKALPHVYQFFSVYETAFVTMVSPHSVIRSLQWNENPACQLDNILN